MIRKFVLLTGTFFTLAAATAMPIGALTPAAFTVTGGALSISAPIGSVSLGTQVAATGSSTISGQLGAVTVSDQRGGPTTWIAAGDAGKVSVIWYRTEPQDGLPDLDCQSGHIHVMEATILGASSKKSQQWTVDAAGRPIHVGQVCQGGTTCVATGQDRRLGDYFTNTLDASGRVLIATGDSRLTDPTTGGPLPTARPLFIRQDGGPPLVGKGTCQ